MPRTSPISIDGVSVQWLPDSAGKVTRCRVRVRDQRGKYLGKRFTVASWDREGLPNFPQAAKQWAESTRGRYIAGSDTVGRADIVAIGRDYVQQLKDRGHGAAHARHYEVVLGALEAEGIRDMKADTFMPRLQHWLANLKANWWVGGDEWQFRRKSRLELKPRTRNAILSKVRRVIRYAMQRGRLHADPLAALERFVEPRDLIPLFTLDELRLMVSDEARYPAKRERERVLGVIAENDGDKRKAAKALRVDLSTIYNKLSDDTDTEDPWWIPGAIMVYTGCRAQEGFHLRWEWFNWEADTITLKVRPEFAIKGQRERIIRLQPELKAILEPRAKPHGWVIESERMRSNGTIEEHKRKKEPAHRYTPAFRRYLRRLGIDPGKRKIHSLRHMFITLMIAKDDTNILKLQRSVGHSGQDFKMTVRYSEQSQEFESVVKAWPQGELMLRRDSPAVKLRPVRAGTRR